MKQIKLYTPKEKPIPRDGRTLICIFNNYLGYNAYTAEAIGNSWQIYPVDAGLFFSEDPELWGEMKDTH
jgi:hypothetical protein